MRDRIGGRLLSMRKVQVLIMDERGKGDLFMSQYPKHMTNPVVGAHCAIKIVV